MLNLKKTAVAVLALGSSAAFAGTMGPVCTPGNVTVPCESQAWDVGIYALYLKPNYSSDHSWVGVRSSDARNFTYVDNDPDWQWGFKLEGSYHFSTGNDVNLNWSHLASDSSTKRHRHVFARERLEILDPDGPGSLFSASVDGHTDHAYSYKPRWDAVNLEFGQHVDFGALKNVRLHGGVQYARIKTEWAANANTRVTGTVTGVEGFPAFDDLSVTGTVNHNRQMVAEMSYNGFGPRIGADMAYDVGNGFSIYANGATAILVGKSKFSRSVNHALSATGTIVDGTETDTGSVGPFTTSRNVSGSRTAIVPEVEAKLGAKYTYAMAQGDLTLDGGWMWSNYFHAQQHAVAFHNAESDFGLQGPYLGLKWVGSVV